MIQKVNLAHKFSLLSEHWSPKIIGELNDSEIKIVKLQGEFVWHHHDDADEMFLIVKGRLRMCLRDSDIELDAGEFVIIPRGVEHMPVADEEVHLILIEPKGTTNTGSAEGERTKSAEWL